MISLTLALALRDAGLAWVPSPGDRFAVTRTEMIDDVFYLADMVIEARPLETGTLFAFNGTTEWALDSVPQSATVWLPDENQLRMALDDTFVTLRREGRDFVVELADGSTHRDPDAENAYAAALLATLA
ncbi:pilus assembly protein CpaE [Tessaracoccus sp. MC1865]|uniref:pilus assembly protein CpaE n=1 Tax=Tessaracoccus sp. MC1865 TaxID=2760310 RepID=UPI0016035B63|nr:pilus assembly protein CpaE [Tessaracoccus sp. MC1865]MBB1482543.1 pilus assembly protein CpaE [Tessaracoccus sp. MC1865]QTO38003.1 pilus assembly protein CpaE [Tessaracoccus sp. MC1865]